MRVTVVASPSYEDHVAIPQHRAGFYAQIEGTSRSVTEYRRGLNIVNEAHRQLPSSPDTSANWSNVEQVKRMVFFG